MLKGKNITLRSLILSDLDFLRKIENNTDNWQFGGEKKEYSDNELLDYILNSNTDIKLAKQYRFVIDLNATPIGFFDLFNYVDRSAGVGIILVETYRNRGFAKEALDLLIHYAFKNINLVRLYCNIAKDNFSSIKLFIACGFELIKQEGELQYFVKLANK